VIRPDCASCRELCPELALGLVTGPERADAFTHLQGCTGCREHLAVLTRLHDELLALIPEAEPPLSFETRVLAPLATTRTGRGPLRPAALVVAGVVAGAAAVALISAAVLGGSFHPATEPAAPSAAVTAGERPVLFAALTAGSREVGQVYAHTDTPSWVYVYVEAGPGQGPLTCTVMRRDGTAAASAPLPRADGDAFWGGPVPIDRATLAGVRVTDATGALLATARFDGPP
jgi:hypothetical protein